MAVACPALKHGKLNFGLGSPDFSRPTPRARIGAVFVVFLSLLPVGWSASPQLLAYRPRYVEQATQDGAFVFCKFKKIV